MSWLRNGRHPRQSVAALGVGFLLAYSAYQGVATLQSSVNPSGLGTSSLAGTVSVFGGSLLLLTATREHVDTLVARVMSYPSIMAASLAICSSYVLAQTVLELSQSGNPDAVESYVRYIVWSSALTGFGGAIVAYCILRYLEDVLCEHPELAVFSTGLFVAFWKLATVCGNLVSSAVLSIIPALNNSDGRVENKTASCGVNFCPSDKFVIGNDISYLNRPPRYVMFWICGIYFVFMALSGLILILGVEDRKGAQGKKRTEAKKAVVDECTDKEIDHKGSDIQQDKLLYTLLLAPMMLSLGVGHAFLEADFTSAYVTCNLGLKYVGWTMICHALFDALGLAIGFHVVKQNMFRPIRVAVALVAILLHLSFITALLVSNTLSITALFGAVAAFGLGSGVLLAVVTLERTPSLATLLFLRLMGLILGYSFSLHLTTAVKLYILIGCTLVGFLGYLVVELTTSPELRDATVKTTDTVVTALLCHFSYHSGATGGFTDSHVDTTTTTVISRQL